MTVMRFDRQRLPEQLLHFFLIQALSAPSFRIHHPCLGPCQLISRCPGFLRSVVYDLGFFCADRLTYHLSTSIQNIFIRCNKTGYNRFPKPVRCIDQYFLLTVSGRVCRKNNPRLFALDHLLDDNRKRDPVLIIPLLLPVTDGTIPPERSVAFLYFPDQHFLADHIQIGLLLSRKAGIGEILCCGGRPHRMEPVSLLWSVLQGLRPCRRHAPHHLLLFCQMIQYTSFSSFIYV